jgi:hypothetical protein
MAALVASCLVLLLLVATVPDAAAVKVVVPPGRTECISEDVTPEHFEVRPGCSICR